MLALKETVKRCKTDKLQVSYVIRGILRLGNHCTFAPYNKHHNTMQRVYQVTPTRLPHQVNRLNNVGAILVEFLSSRFLPVTSND